MNAKQSAHELVNRVRAAVKRADAHNEENDKQRERDLRTRGQLDGRKRYRHTDMVHVVMNLTDARNAVAYLEDEGWGEQ